MRFLLCSTMGQGPWVLGWEHSQIILGPLFPSPWGLTLHVHSNLTLFHDWKVLAQGGHSHMYTSLYNERLCYDIWNIVTQRVLTRVFFWCVCGVSPKLWWREGGREGFCLKATWSQSGEGHYHPRFTINYTWEWGFESAWCENLGHRSSSRKWKRNTSLYQSQAGASLACIHLSEKHTRAIFWHVLTLIVRLGCSLCAQFASSSLWCSQYHHTFCPICAQFASSLWCSQYHHTFCPISFYPLTWESPNFQVFVWWVCITD